MRNVFFLCHSRYTIFVAYFIKKIYHETDFCTLIVSDCLEDSDIFAEDSNNIWDRVIILEEKNVEPLEVERNVNDVIENFEINVFYISHVMKCASHFFSHFLKEDTEVNLIDEGIISLDLLRGYKHFSKNGLPVGWMDFSFDRIDNFYVLFPQITEKVGKATIKKIDLRKMLTERLEETVSDLNHLFNYHYVPLESKILFVDSDMAEQGYITQRYENHCIDNVMRYLNIAECTVKIKPSLPEDMLKMKYGKYNLKFLRGGNIPFEIIYLNCLIHRDMIPIIIALPTTLIWNLILINESCDIENCSIISLAEIMHFHFFDIEEGKDMLKKVYAYQRCFRKGYGARIPKTWDDFFDEISSKNENFCIADRCNFMEEEYWSEVEQNRLFYLENMIVSAKYQVIKRWLFLEMSKVPVYQYFLDRGISHIVLYGLGVFGNLLMQNIGQQQVTIDCIILTKENPRLKTEIPICLVSQYKQKPEDNVPILITAVGKEKEVIDIIHQHNIKNQVLCFSEIIRYLESEYLIGDK